MANDRSKSGYIFTERKSYKAVDVGALSAHIEKVQKDVVPRIKEQGEKKETGAHRLRLKGII
ncbi:hypothetical protein [Pseudoxanthomonas sp. CF125]|uniref:hypothetical protein n=1 Tax=Pseudoxanthomonas sp. CF125 TaxID=1855303 RepID=UPI000884EEEF|nr:hypothetical protein [Pseudoxanthomonas sp. CF125]SDQ82106.1 hypothetical protein SAMN05216569_2184 [Pseudoxanthomonas sp. CF125]